MSVLDRLIGVPDQGTIDHVTEVMESADLAEEIQQAVDNLELMLESYADVELALEDRGWRLLSLQADRQFTRQGLKTAAKLARTMAIVNPLIRRGLNLRTAYVWGGGVEITARATGASEDNDAEQDVNAVIQEFLEDPTTQKVLSSATARETNERTLGTDGMFALALFTKPLTGRVQPREIPTDEITEVISNPDDATEVWFYKRVTTAGTTYHPDIDYRPRGARPIRIGGELVGGARVGAGQVMWDAPVILLKVNGLSTWDFGIGDAFAAMPWARGYKEFLEDWAKLVKALSRFAWRATSTSKGKAQQAADKIRTAVQPTTPTVGTGPVGGIAAMGPGNVLEAIPKSGATIDSDSGKPLAAMVAAAMDVPVTMLLADPGQTGARAVAETLDKPTELMAIMRRAVWADFHRRLLGYVIDQAVKAPRGALLGTVARDDWDREVITLAGDTERTIEIEWPDLTELSVKDLVEAIARADDTGKLPPVTTVKLLLAALGVKDADELLEAVTDKDGNWVDPMANAGDEAVKRARRGEGSADDLVDDDPDE